MLGKYNGFVRKRRVSACMYFLVLLNISSHIDRDGSGEPGSNAINTAINHIHWSLLFTAVETTVYTCCNLPAAQNTNYKL